MNQLNMLNIGKDVQNVLFEFYSKIAVIWDTVT